MNSTDHIQASSNTRAYDRGLLAGYLYATQGVPFRNPYMDALRRNVSFQTMPAILEHVNEYRLPNLEAQAEAYNNRPEARRIGGIR